MSKKGVAAGPSAHPTLVFLCKMVVFQNRLFQQERFKVSAKENEVPTEKNSSRASIFATKASYISN